VLHEEDAIDDECWDEEEFEGVSVSIRTRFRNRSEIFGQNALQKRRFVQNAFLSSASWSQRVPVKSSIFQMITTRGENHGLSKTGSGQKSVSF